MLVTNTTHEGLRKHTTARPVRLGRVSVKFVFVGLLAALALLYLTQSTQSAARSYQLRALLEERKDLEHERDRLEIEAVRLRSLPEIQRVVPSEAPTEGEPVAWEAVKDVRYLSGSKPVAEKKP